MLYHHAVYDVTPYAYPYALRPSFYRAHVPARHSWITSHASRRAIEIAEANEINMNYTMRAGCVAETREGCSEVCVSARVDDWERMRFRVEDVLCGAEMTATVS